MIPIYKPTIAPYTKSAIDAITSGWISNHGDYLKLATELLQTKLNIKHAILMANGTVATHSLFLALQYFHPTIKKIYVPNHVFIAAINAALMVYPLSMLSVVQTDPATFNMVETEQYLATLEKGAALLVVHTVGNIVNVPRIQRLRPDLIVLEDACEGLFGTYEGLSAGTAAFASSISFYGNKTITTGEGGAFLTPHDDVAAYIRRIYSQGATNIRYVHDGIGYNYRMTNVEAAFLYDQLNDLSTILDNKCKVYNMYVNLIKDLSGCRVQTVSQYTTHSMWMFSIELPIPAIFYPLLEADMLVKGVELRPFFYSLPTHSHLGSLSVPNELSKCIIMLPSSPSLTLEDQVQVVKALQSSLQLFQPTIVPASVDSVTQFLSNAVNGEQTTFRYFKSRPISVIEKHLQTLLLTVKDVPIGYAHLEKHEDVVWVGLCVLKTAQGCKYGSILLDAVCKYADANAVSLELTVDTTNIIAQHLYTKFKFTPTHLDNGILRMQRGQLTLPVSVGEALDKLSILDIKLLKITDKRSSDVMTEYNAINLSLANYHQKFSKLYTFLKAINLNIWNLQDKLRASTTRDISYVNTCLQILDKNDVRFRIKNKINKMSNSVLKEQKGYPLKQALFVSHLGMGDMINMVGAVRYYSLQYDIVRVAALKEYEHNIRDLYKDDPTIHIEVLSGTSYQEKMQSAANCIYKYESTHTLLISGILHHMIIKKQNTTYTAGTDIIKQFYTELNLPLSIHTDYFWVGCSTPPEDFKRLPKEYIFLHDVASTETKLLPGAPTSSDTRFIVHPNRNIYEPDSPWYALAESFVGKPLFYYNDIISNAVELHLIDSSFFCIASHLPRLNCTKHVVYTRTRGALYESIAPKSIWTYISL